MKKDVDSFVEQLEKAQLSQNEIVQLIEALCKKYAVCVLESETTLPDTPVENTDGKLEEAPKSSGFSKKRTNSRSFGKGAGASISEVLARIGVPKS